MKRYLVKFHLFMLVFLLFNFILRSLIGFSLNETIIFSFKIFLCISGFALFIFYIRPVKILTFYFSYYFLTPIIAILGYVFGGMFLVGILGSFFLTPIIPKNVVVETNDIVVYTKFQGFLAPCCSYEVVEKNLFLFEKKLGDINGERIDFTQIKRLDKKTILKLIAQSSE